MDNRIGWVGLGQGELGRLKAINQHLQEKAFTLDWKQQGQVKQALKDKLGDQEHYLTYKEFLEVILELSETTEFQDSARGLRDYLANNFTEIKMGTKGFTRSSLTEFRVEFWTHLDNLLLNTGGDHRVWEILEGRERKLYSQKHWE